MSKIINIHDIETFKRVDRRNDTHVAVSASQIRKLVITGSILATFLDLHLKGNGQASVLAKLWHSQLEQFRREAKS